MEILAVSVLGLIIGSFLNVCIYRVPQNESIAFPPSHCTNCGQRIKWYDLVPVISYIALKGRCRHCNEKISIRYPLVELLTAIIFSALYIKFGHTLSFVKYAVMSGFLIVIGFIDYDTTDVYLKNTLPAIISGALFILLSYMNGEGTVAFIYGGALSYGVIALIILITKGMGWGDAEICLFCGLFLGFKLSILMLFLSFIGGGAVGIIQILRKKISIKNTMAFGPFIAAAAVITSLFGDKLIFLYLQRFV